jgi:acyl dehydratase
MRVFKTIEEMAAASGQEIGVSDWFTIDQARVNTFADATNDHQWIHVDTERAKRELPTRGTIVQGFLTLSLVPWLSSMMSECKSVSRVINYGLNKVRFPNMIATGSRVRLRSKLLNAEKRAGGMQFLHEYTIEIEDEERPACVAEMITILYP